MMSYPELMDDWDCPLFGGQLQDVFPTEGSQYGDVQYGFKQSIELVKSEAARGIPTNYEIDQLLWTYEDLDDLLYNYDSTSLAMVHHPLVEQNYFTEFIPIQDLPSSPEQSISPVLSVSPEFDSPISNLGRAQTIDFQPWSGEENVQNSPNLNSELDLHSSSVDFDPSGSFQDPAKVLELLHALNSNPFVQSFTIASEPMLLPQMPPEVVDTVLSNSPTSSVSVLPTTHEITCEEISWGSPSPPSASSYEMGCSSPGSVSSCSSGKSDFSRCSRAFTEAQPRVVKHERRIRKKEQNKTAALKYRQKKREEHGSFRTECEQLEKKNIELKTRVTEISKEISYLKGLMAEMADYSE
jgi:hypothetical protein